MIFERKHKIGIDEVNKNFKMTNESIITVFQNLASFNSDAVGYGVLNVPKTGKTWVVVDWKLRVLRRPRYGENVLVRTWGRNTEGLISLRDFEIRSDNELCAVATSKWMLIDLKTRKPIEIDEEIINAFGEHNEFEVFMDEEYEKIKPLETYDKSKKINIRKSDLDFNNHVNNIKYFDYISELSENKNYNDVRISYLKEINEDENVSIYLSEIGEVDHYLIKNSNDEIKTIIECKQTEY